MKTICVLLRGIVTIGLFSLTVSSYAQNRKVETAKQKVMENMKNRQELLEKAAIEKETAMLKLEEARRYLMQQQKQSNMSPEEMKRRMGSIKEIHKHFGPIYYELHNVNAARSTRTNFLHSGGSLGLNLSGEGMRIGIWDGSSTLVDHVEYFDINGAGPRRSVVGDGPDANNDKAHNQEHGAHVTGTVLAAGVNPMAKGMAPQATSENYNWIADLGEVMAFAANGGILSNHSYAANFRECTKFDSNGNCISWKYLPNPVYGGYLSYARDWDQVTYDAPYYLPVMAAGNNGFVSHTENPNAEPLDGNPNYDKLLTMAIAKNPLLVANARDANVESNGKLNNVFIHYSSSQGPTDDYRIKPDITGNGDRVFSSINSSPTSYKELTGTSMASPNVAGSLLLLQEHYAHLNGAFMRAATLKGLAIHTADDAGIEGPDAIFGWGLMNAKRAAEVISEKGVSSIIDEVAIKNQNVIEMNVTANGNNPLIVSISWTDPPKIVTADSAVQTNDNTPVLINDLDVRIIQGGETYLPWELTGVASNARQDNNRDPYERIKIDNPQGDYTIRITHKNSLQDGFQNFSLIVSGITVNEGTVPVVVKEIDPIDDAYVRGGQYNDENYGMEDRLIVRYDSTSYENRLRSYLKFDLSDYENIQKLELKMVGIGASESSSETIVPVFAVTNDSWEEESITWSNKPDIMTPYLDIQTGSKALKTYMWNVTESIQTIGGDGMLSLAVNVKKENAPLYGHIFFRSKEHSNASVRPKLIVRYQASSSIGQGGMGQGSPILKKTVLLGDKETENMLVYPNPNSGDFNIKFKSPDKSNATVTILNSYGSLVYTKEVVLEAGENQVAIQGTKLNTGYYILKIASATQMFTAKFIVK